LIEIVEYVDIRDRSPFRDWFDGLDAQTAAIITVSLARLASGNTSKVKSIGDGVAEVKINRGPGYRVYFGWDGKNLVILLGGGTKRRQQDDIDAALICWRDYLSRKPRSDASMPGKKV